MFSNLYSFINPETPTANSISYTLLVDSGDYFDLRTTPECSQVLLGKINVVCYDNVTAKVVSYDLLRTDCYDGHETVGDNEQCILLIC
jgi:hypothetical protein